MDPVKTGALIRALRTHLGLTSKIWPTALL